MSNTRTIALFTMHARVGENIIEYNKFFQWVQSLTKRSTRLQVQDDLIFVIERIQAKDSIFEITFISGDPTDIPINFNETTGQIEEGSSSSEIWPARQTRVLVDAQSRLVAVENRRAGVGSLNLEKYFRKLATCQGYSSKLSFDLTIQPGSSFEKELTQFERIREASITIRRPNQDWEDAEAELSDLADASAGHRASITINAGRGDSLNKSNGIVSAIGSEIKRPKTSVDNARIVGVKQGEQQESTLSLSNHQVKKRISLPRGLSSSQERSRVFSGALELIRSTLANNLSKNPPEDKS